MAIALRAAAPGSATPREQFVTDLLQRLAVELSEQPDGAQPHPLPARPARQAVDGTRRRLVQAGSIAAAAAAVGAVVDHTVSAYGPSEVSGGQAAQTLTPSSGVWRTVGTSADLGEGGVQAFDLGTVVGFVARTGGQLQAVSGVHPSGLPAGLGFRGLAAELPVPHHLVRDQRAAAALPAAGAPRPLPHFQVREVEGAVQIYACTTGWYGRSSLPVWQRR